MKDTVVRDRTMHTMHRGPSVIVREFRYSGLYLLVSDHMGHTSTTRLRLYLPEIEIDVILPVGV